MFKYVYSLNYYNKTSQIVNENANLFSFDRYLLRIKIQIMLVNN